MLSSPLVPGLRKGYTPALQRPTSGVARLSDLTALDQARVWYKVCCFFERGQVRGYAGTIARRCAVNLSVFFLSAVRVDIVVLACIVGLRDRTGSLGLRPAW